MARVLDLDDGGLDEIALAVITLPADQDLGLGIFTGAVDVAANAVEGTLVGNPDIVLKALSAIEDGGEGSLTFIRSSNFAKNWEHSNCQAALVTEGFDIPGHDPENRALIYVPDADVAVIKILEAIDPGIAAPAVGIHPNATIDPSATISTSASIGPGCVICKDATIGDHVVLIANVYIGQRTQVGNNTFVHPGVVVGDRCTVGQRGLIFANCAIGADGFGFLIATKDRPTMKVPQIGYVEIGDDVEIGA